MADARRWNNPVSSDSKLVTLLASRAGSDAWTTASMPSRPRVLTQAVICVGSVDAAVTTAMARASVGRRISRPGGGARMQCADEVESLLRAVARGDCLCELHLVVFALFDRWVVRRVRRLKDSGEIRLVLADHAPLPEVTAALLIEAVEGSHALVGRAAQPMGQEREFTTRPDGRAIKLTSDCRSGGIRRANAAEIPTRSSFHATRCAKIAFTLAKMAFSLAAWWFGAPRALCAASALSGFEVARGSERSLRASALTGLANMQYSKGKSPGLSGQDDRPVVTGGLRSADSKRAHLQPGRLVRQGRRREPDLLHHRRRSGLRPRAVPVIESSARTSRCGTGRRATSISTAAK